MSEATCFWLYLLECENGNYYTGYTKNLVVRYYQHKRGKQSAKYTRSFKPVRIAQCWKLYAPVAMALKLERYIKRQSKATKENWIQHPEVLREMITKKLDLDFQLFPFDAAAVEKESAKLDWKQVKSGYDPFVHDAPPGDVKELS
ncbi:MAG: GIY-YIG nuclease family protein [Nitrospinota bacterium]|nr:GIY-YIG nuclease family protein [Nitrospinota bacterium]